MLLAIVPFAVDVDAQERAPMSLERFIGPPCRSAPRRPFLGVYSCDTIRSVHEGAVSAELVEHGWHADVHAIDLVIRSGGRSWVRRAVGESGTGSDTFGLYDRSFVVQRLEVADVLFDARPEIILQTQSDERVQGSRNDPPPTARLVVCSTGPRAPRCVDLRVPDAQAVRFERPNVVHIGEQRHTVELRA